MSFIFICTLYIYVRIHIYVYVHIDFDHQWLLISSHKFIFICTYTYVYMYVFTCIYVYIWLSAYMYIYGCPPVATGWQRPIGCLISIGHCPQKSPTISGYFAKNDLQLKAFYGFSPPCTDLVT